MGKEVLDCLALAGGVAAVESLPHLLHDSSIYEVVNCHLGTRKKAEESPKQKKKVAEERPHK